MSFTNRVFFHLIQLFGLALLILNSPRGQSTGTPMNTTHVNSVNVFLTRKQNKNNLDEIEIECSTNYSGAIVPSISWYFTSMNTKTKIEPFTAGYMLSSTKLTITATDPIRSGEYECSASLNNVTSTVRRMSILIQVYSPPAVSIEMASDRNVFSPLERSVFQVNCTICGLETPTVRWLVNGNPSNNTGVTVHSVITRPTLDSHNISTTLSRVESYIRFTSVGLDLKSVRCTATNSLGTASVEAEVRVESLGRPCAPVQLREIGSESSLSLLEWRVNTNCAEKFQFASSYIFEVTASSGERNEVEYHVNEEEIRDKMFSFYLTGLTPNTAYQIRVSGKNIFGTSQYSGRITVVTAPVGKKVMFYYGAENGDSEMEHNYWAQSPPLHLATTIPMGAARLSSVFVTPFGTLSLDRRSYSWYPQTFPGRYYTSSLSILAPFWSDVDYSEEGHISYRVYQSGSDVVESRVVAEATELSQAQAGAPLNFTAQAVIVATWSEVVPWGYRRVYVGTNTFQAAIVTDYEQTYALFGYNCGEMSWSSSATYPTKPVIGFNARGVLFSSHFLSRQSLSHRIGCQTQDYDSTIVGYKVSLDLPSDDTSESACIKWFLQDQLINPDILSLPASPCPCNLRQAIFDAQFRFDFVSFLTNTFSTDVLCFVSRFPNSGVYQRCCYGFSIFTFFFFLSNTPLLTSGNERGSLLSTTPRFYPDSLYQRYREQDEEGYTQCCLLSNSCHLYFRRRPSDDCTGYVFTPFTWAFGDPHVITIDGLKYTFNGVGEYWYLFPVGDCDYQVQTRTELFRDTHATAFTAVAVTINNCSNVFVSLLGKDGLSLFVDSINRTEEARSLGELIVGDCLEIEYMNASATQKTQVKAAYNNGASLNVQSNGDLITMNLTVPEACKLSTQGLLGQWDDNINNDFLMRNGTLLSPNVTDRIKEKFAESWRITLEESLMNYMTGDYNQYNPNHTSTIFLDEIIGNVSMEIQELCMGEVSCLFDAFVTNDTSIATASLSITTESQASVQIAGNMPPLILAPPLLNLTLNNLVTYQFNVTDEDDFSVSQLLFPLLSFQQVALSNSSRTQFSLRLSLMDIPESLNVTIIANDSLGISIRSVTVVVCHCENGGYCTPDVPAVGVSGFSRSSCQCPLSYEGLYCSSPVTDMCLQSVCLTEACPAGTIEDTNTAKCEDIDECTTNCKQLHQVCNNTYGSYLCSCEAGYQMRDGECVDSDECYYPISPCQHLCTNTQGSFTCECNQNYQLEPDQSSCRGIDSGSCPNGMEPPYQCENNTCTLQGTELVCQYCPRGTELSSNGRGCEDVDECVLQSDICPPDSSLCRNVYGSFNCLCFKGYDDIQDTCVDVDECFSITPVCAAGESCFNTPGSYVCASFCYLPNHFLTPDGQCRVVESNVSRVPENTERLIITFSLSFSELSESLTARSLSLSTLYSALNATLRTPRENILFIETQTSEGAFQLLAISDSFQVDPSLVTGLLRTDFAPEWAPYYSYVTSTSVDISSVQPDFGIATTTLIIASICAGVFLLMFLFTISCFWALFVPKLKRSKKEDKNGSLYDGLLSELNKLKDNRAKPRPSDSMDYSPNWPKGTIESNNLIQSTLSYLLAESPPFAIYGEFNSIPMHLATVEDTPPGCEQKNRFNNILPPPHSRVPLFLKYGLPNSDYINANFVRGYDMTPRVYIATQAPLFETEQDFWRMIWEQNTEVIIMLTEIVERGREKCIPYWPDKDILTSIRSGGIEIISKRKIVKEDYQIDEFILKHVDFNEVHEVSHYWYRKWPEYGVPCDPNPLVSMLIESRAKPRNSSHPVVVHCASGTGRTGVALGVDIGMQELDETRSVDILQNVCLMRQDRGGLIQTQDQYHFLHKCVCVYARYIDSHPAVRGAVQK